ncbi:MAG: hypothetical protein CMN30_30145 [Sandaracinus sp.]|nr:hypothetical protein [Sandaracinus sp.]
MVPCAWCAVLAARERHSPHVASAQEGKTMGAAVAFVREQDQTYRQAGEGTAREASDRARGDTSAGRERLGRGQGDGGAGQAAPPRPTLVPPVDSGPDPRLDPTSAHQALLTLAARRAADDVAMLEPLLVAHEGRIHEALGLGSFHEYCSRLFGWCGRTTRERLRVAKAMRDLPAMRARWAAGELTYSVVRELTRVATPAVEAD